MSVCDGSAVISSCAPYANVHDVAALLQEFCKECYAEVPAGTDEVDFCNDGFGGAGDENCDFLMIKRGTAPNEEYYISDDCNNWYQITWEDNVGNVPNGTLPEDFIETAWGSIADMPDPNYAPIIFIIEEDCGIWIAVNDTANCDLGTVPSTPGTGTSWVEITIVNIENRLKIAGLEVEAPTITTAIINPGSCRDAEDIVDIATAVPINLDATTTGANGLDANDVALANNTWYYVYIIWGSAGTAGFISTSAAPTYPVGYSRKRRVGWLLTDGSAQFMLTVMRDNIVFYPATLNILYSVNLAVAWTLLNTIASFVPPTGRFAYFSWYGAMISANAIIHWSIDGGTNIIGRSIAHPGDPPQGDAIGPLPLDSSQQAWIYSDSASDENMSLYLWAYIDDRWDVT